MPEIDVKHFVGYLTYNNNRNDLRFDPIYNLNISDEKIVVLYSEEGMAIFQNCDATFGQKLAYYKALHAGLLKEFGCGLSVAFAPHSDCSDDYEMAYFCKVMKQLDPSIRTVVYATPTGYVPYDEKQHRGLKDTWRLEPYESSPVLSNIGVQNFQGSITAALPEGVYYLVSPNLFNRGEPAVFVRELLGVTQTSAGLSGEYLTIGKAMAERIQRVANAAFIEAMDPTRQQELKEVRAPYF